MAKRKVRKPRKTTHKRKTKKTSRKKTVRRKSRKTARKSAKSAAAKDVLKNRQAHWQAFRNLEKRCDQAWAKLKADTKRKADAAILIRDRNHLALLLGECDYMARECMRMAWRRQKP